MTMEPPTTQTTDGGPLPTDGGEDSEGSSSDDEQSDNGDGGANDPSSGGLPSAPNRHATALPATAMNRGWTHD